MFCRPGAAARRRTRRDRQQQRNALAEARAAGWHPGGYDSHGDDSDENSSDEDAFHLRNNNHNVTFAIVGRDNVEAAPTLTTTMTPEQMVAGVVPLPPTADGLVHHRPGAGDDSRHDNDLNNYDNESYLDDYHDNDDESIVAREVQEQLSVLLQRLQFRSPAPPPPTAPTRSIQTKIAVTTTTTAKIESGRVAAMGYGASAVPTPEAETTETDVTETEVTVEEEVEVDENDDDEKVFGDRVRSGDHVDAGDRSDISSHSSGGRGGGGGRGTRSGNKNLYNDDDDDQYDDDDDDDSIDLGGVRTSVWDTNTTSDEMPFPTGQQPLAKFLFGNQATNNHSESGNNYVTPTRTKSHDTQGGDDSCSLEDDDDGGGRLDHAGAHVFLATESARYAGDKEGVWNVLPASDGARGQDDNDDSDGIRVAPHAAYADDNVTANRLFRRSGGGTAAWHMLATAQGGGSSSGTNHGATAANYNNEHDKDDHENDATYIFRPRYEEDEGNDDNIMWENLKAATKQPLGGNTPCEAPKAEGTCFGGVHMIFPHDFDENTQTKSTATAATKVTSSIATPIMMSPLASLVHPMDLSLFVDKTKDAPYKDYDESSVCSEAVPVASPQTPVHRSPASVLLQMEQYTITGSAGAKDGRRSNLSSSFASSTKGGHRVVYNLSSGKKAMSKMERIYTKSYLPNKPVLVLGSKDHFDNDRSLYVLLVDIPDKIFEVVKVEIDRDTKVGDVLAKARATATDPALSEQKYISLCFSGQEFAAPMLPVNLLIDWRRNKTSPLVVAVPDGSSAAEMQLIKQVLWKNPKLRRWWKQKDPFQPQKWPAKPPPTTIPELAEQTNVKDIQPPAVITFNNSTAAVVEETRTLSPTAAATDAVAPLAVPPNPNATTPSTTTKKMTTTTTTPVAPPSPRRISV